ncbi:glycosyltransferase [Clostridium chrysemydis]|uniref:glycosyltransferase n=1 Tax=Clostridium chrysemydis TaxID=2665504 RepID=UPI003F31E5A4
MEKVIFITTRNIFPINGGREVVLYNYCKGLVDQYKCNLSIISFSSPNRFGKPNFIDSQYYLGDPNLLVKAKNLIFKSLCLRKFPFQVSLYYSKRNQRKINEIVNKVNPDIVICDMARTAEYVKNLPNRDIKKILDMDDLLSNRYKGQAKNSILKNSILGQYESKVPKIVSKLLDLSNIKKSALLMEAMLLKKYELNIGKHFEKVIFVSPKECKEYDGIIKEKKSVCITIGVDYQYYSEKKGENKEKIICFLGNMYVPHNQDAVEYFMKNIFEDIKKHNNDVKFRIIGKCSEEYKKSTESEFVEVTGEVDDIRKYVQECSIAVAPLTYGSGIKTKILETMAMGIPVVTNDIGIEGINIKNGYDIFVCNSKKEYIDIINKVFVNKKLAESIADNAKNTIRESYTWEKTLIPFGDIVLRR